MYLHQYINFHIIISKRTGVKFVSSYEVVFNVIFVVPCSKKKNTSGTSQNKNLSGPSISD